MDEIQKKSFTIADLDDHQIRYIKIPQKKMRTRYKYDISSFAEQVGRSGDYVKEKVEEIL